MPSLERWRSKVPKYAPENCRRRVVGRSTPRSPPRQRSRPGHPQPPQQYLKQSNLFISASRFKLAHRRLESTGTSAKLGAQVILSSTTAPPDAWNPQPEFVLA